MSKVQRDKVNLSKRKGLSLSDKIEVLFRQAKCNICYDQIFPDLTEWDHIIPIALGGTNSPNNFQAICKKCHLNKTKKDVSDIYKALRMSDARKSRVKIKSAKFSKKYVKKLDGTVILREKEEK